MYLDGWRSWGRDDSTCRAADARLSKNMVQCTGAAAVGFLVSVVCDLHVGF